MKGWKRPKPDIHKRPLALIDQLTVARSSQTPQSQDRMTTSRNVTNRTDSF